MSSGCALSPRRIQKALGPDALFVSYLRQWYGGYRSAKLICETYDGGKAIVSRWLNIAFQVHRMSYGPHRLDSVEDVGLSFVRQEQLFDNLRGFCDTALQSIHCDPITPGFDRT
jgi:hypothetical protein